MTVGPVVWVLVFLALGVLIAGFAGRTRSRGETPTGREAVLWSVGFLGVAILIFVLVLVDQPQ